MSRGAGLSAGAPTVALLPWGDVIEDFLDSIGVSFHSFRTEMTGGWLFGYIDALATAGVRTVLVCVSARIRRPERFEHAPTGAPLWLLPAPAAYRAVRGGGLSSGAGWKADLLPYLATPVIQVARTLRQEGCRAILCQEYEYARFDACAAIGKLLRIPLFATFQGGDWQASRLERPLRPLALRAAAGLIVPPQSERDRLTERYGFPRHKIHRIFNPVDHSEWAAGDGARVRSELGIPEAVPLIVWHGRVDVHRKGLDVLAAAWDLVSQDCGALSPHLLLVGTGTDAPELRTLLATRALPRVHWLDEYVLDRQRLAAHLAAADVYVLPSRHEGFPVAPIEAMASGLPVVATDVHGVRDILGSGAEAVGRIVPPADAAALAAALLALAGDAELRRDLGAAARQRAEQHFSLTAVGEQLRRLLLGSSPRPNPGAALAHAAAEKARAAARLV